MNLTAQVITRMIYLTILAQTDCIFLAWDDWEPWGTCSETCNGGQKRREKICKDSSQATKPDSECLGFKPIEEEVCNAMSCPG